MARLNKATTFQKIRDNFDKLDETFTVMDVYKLTGIRSVGIKRALKGFEELGLIKYVESNTLYIKVNNNNVNKNQSDNITNICLKKTGALNNDNC